VATRGFGKFSQVFSACYSTLCFWYFANS